MLEILCAIVVMALLFASLFGGFNLNSLVIVVMAVAVYAVLRDLRSLWQLKQSPSSGYPPYRAHGRHRDTTMAAPPPDAAGHGQPD